MSPAQLVDLFLRERARFGLVTAGLVLEDRHYLGRVEPRDMAWSDLDRNTVHVLQRALGLPKENLVAIVRHELAHLVNPAASEAETDALATRVGGCPIRYDAREVQTVGRGGPRPRRLRG